MPVPAYILPQEDGVLLDLHVQPNARQSQLAGEHGGRLKIRIASPPVDGKANREICRFIATTCGVSKSAVTLVHGTTGRQKRVHIRGLRPADLSRCLSRQGTKP